MHESLNTLTYHPLVPSLTSLQPLFPWTYTILPQKVFPQALHQHDSSPSTVYYQPSMISPSSTSLFSHQDSSGWKQRHLGSELKLSTMHNSSLLNFFPLTTYTSSSCSFPYLRASYHRRMMVVRPKLKLEVEYWPSKLKEKTSLSQIFWVLSKMEVPLFSLKRTSNTLDHIIPHPPLCKRLYTFITN